MAKTHFFQPDIQMIFNHECIIYIYAYTPIKKGISEAPFQNKERFYSGFRFCLKSFYSIIFNVGKCKFRHLTFKSKPFSLQELFL